MSDIFETSYQIYINKNSTYANKGNITRKINKFLKDQEISDNVIFKTEYWKKITNDNIISKLSFKIDYDAEVIYLIENVLKECDFLNIIKIKDTFESIKIIEHHNEIFEMEMKLREAIYIILLDSYPYNNWYDLFTEYKSDSKPGELRMYSGINRENFLKKRMLNEIFYLLFSQYKKLLNTRDLNTSEILDFLKKANNFIEFKSKIFTRGISKESYQDFLSSIQINLESIEKFRNDIAHSRFIDKDKYANYQLAKTNIDSSLNRFFSML